MSPSNNQSSSSDVAEMPPLMESSGPPLSFEVGGQVWLEFSRDDDVQRIPTKVRGWVEKNCFFVDVPMSDGDELPSRKGEHLNVRYVFQGMLHSFATQFVRKINTPCNLWCIHYPEIHQSQDLRRQQRVQPLVTITLNEHEKPGVMLDLSAGGALLRLPAELPVPQEGESMSISFMLPNGERVEDLTAIVRADNGADGVGVEFDQSEEGTAAVRRFIDLTDTGSHPTA